MAGHGAEADVGPAPSFSFRSSDGEVDSSAVVETRTTTAEDTPALGASFTCHLVLWRPSVPLFDEGLDPRKSVVTSCKSQLEP